MRLLTGFKESVETQSQTDIIDGVHTTPQLISSMANKQPLKSDSHPSLAGWPAAAAQDNIAETL